MGLTRSEVIRPDGRRLWFYSWEREPPRQLDVSPLPAVGNGGLELRWHPLLEEWVALAPDRQERTFLPPADLCPLCPTQDPSRPTEVPAADYEIAVFENRFPTFTKNAPTPVSTSPFPVAPATGSCEVVLYTPEHDAALADLSEVHIARLVDVWVDRYAELASRPEVAYVYVFENRGREIGVTLTHPHGQIYAFPYVPPHVERELAGARRYRRAHGRCLHCLLATNEPRDGRRMVYQSDGFVAFVPPFARLPYEVHVVSRRHRTSLLDLTRRERRELAAALRAVELKYDNLWQRPMPFVMAMHQRPTDGRRYPGCHFHIEFTPPYRSRDKLKYLAGVETGAGTYIVDARPENTAQELRWAEPKT